jgi:hypothetical protein
MYDVSREVMRGIYSWNGKKLLIFFDTIWFVCFTLAPIRGHSSVVTGTLPVWIRTVVSTLALCCRRDC